MKFGLQRRVEAEQVPVADLGRRFHFVLAVVHAAFDAVEFAGGVPDDQGRPGTTPLFCRIDRSCSSVVAKLVRLIVATVSLCFPAMLQKLPVIYPPPQLC